MNSADGLTVIAQGLSVGKAEWFQTKGPSRANLTSSSGYKQLSREE